MKTISRFLIAALFFPVPAVHSAIVYSGYQNLAVPQTFEGLFLNPVTGATTTMRPGDFNTAPWINPFFGGVGISSGALMRPVITGASQVLNLSVGTSVNTGSTFASGESGSDTHTGGGVGQFAIGTPGNIGYQFQTTTGGADSHGWLNTTISNTGDGVIRDWAYDDAGGSIVVGRVVQSAPSAGTQNFTLSPGVGESFTLGSAITDTGGNVNTLIKSGGGTVTLATSGLNTYTGRTVLEGGTLILGANNVIPGAAAMELAGGTLDAGGAVNAAGPLLLSASSVIDMASGGSALTFADSSAVLGWSGTLSIWNWTPGLDFLRFGTTSGGLSSAQLSQITVFSGPGTGTVYATGLDSNGYLVAVPEPGALLVVLLLLGGIGWRERHVFLRVRRQRLL